MLLTIAATAETVRKASSAVLTKKPRTEVSFLLAIAVVLKM
jgi:hypothetical protein